MNRQAIRKLLALLCGLMLMGATLLTGCAAKPQEEAETPNAETEENEAVAIYYLPTQEADGTHSFQIVKGTEVLFSKSGMDRAAIKEVYTEDVFSISWVTGNNPTDYESVYCNKKTGVVSEVIVGALFCDGVRVVYPQRDETGCSAIVRDIFDKNTFCYAQPLADAYVGGEYTVMGAIAIDETHVNVSYLINSEGTHRFARVDVYPDGKPTANTKKTETAQKTEATKK